MFKSSSAIVLILSGAVAFAQESPRPAAADSEKAAAERKTSTSLPAPARRRARTRANATPMPVATPLPQGFFHRLFGRRTKPPQRATAPATPPPAVSRPRKPRSANVSRDEAADRRAENTRRKEEAGTEKPDNASQTESDSKQPPAPRPEEVTGTESAASLKSKPAKGERTAAKKSAPPPEAQTPEAQEKWKYDQARATAGEDPEIRTLKEKADAAPNEEEGRRALRAYNKALFDKMRRIDPTIKERIDAMEAGVLKRLGE